MDDRIALVLHEEVDEAYAAALAAALSPVRAITTAFAAARDLKLGAGATCVIVWTSAVTPDSVKDVGEFAGIGEPGACLPSGIIGVCLPDAAPPDVFARTGVRTIAGNGNPNEDAAAVRESLTQFEALNTGSPTQARAKRHRAAMDGAHRTSLSANPKPAARLITRSAIGMAATVAVVAFASQYIGTRARAAAGASDDGVGTAAQSLERSPSAPSAGISEEADTLSPASVATVDARNDEALLRALSPPASSAHLRAAPRARHGTRMPNARDQAVREELLVSDPLDAGSVIPEPTELQPLLLDAQQIAPTSDATESGASATEQVEAAAPKKARPAAASSDANSIGEEPIAFENSAGKAQGAETT